MSDGSCQEKLEAASTLERQGRVAESIAAYEQLLQFWPGLPDCWYNLARLQRHTGQYTRALGSYQEALERNVTSPEEVHLNRGVIFSDFLNQYDAAERDLRKALEINPTYVPARINYANPHRELRRPGVAAGTWWVWGAPAATPRESVNTRSAAMAKVLQMPDIRQRLIDLGFDPLGSTPEECAANIRSEIAKWSRVVASAKIRVD